MKLNMTYINKLERSDHDMTDERGYVGFGFGNDWLCWILIILIILIIFCPGFFGGFGYGDKC